MSHGMNFKTKHPKGVISPAKAAAIIPNIGGAKDIYRRDVQKSDGRMLHLYGYNPHSEAIIDFAPTPIAKGGELRWHPLRQEWNIYAPHRQNRTFKPLTANDPLAPSSRDGHETEIPFTDFELAVFENKFTSLHRDAAEPQAVKTLKMGRANGHCDVIVYGPEADGNLYAIGQEKRRLLLAAWVDRYQSLYGKGLKFVLPFENRGDEVGVTLHHPHGQIYAFPFIPDVQKRALNAFQNGYDLPADIASFAPDFTIAQTDDMSAFCPPYARFPYEVWISPTEFSPGPWAFNETLSDSFAHLLGEVTRKYDEFFQRPTPYMLNLHAAPAGHDDCFHFTAQFYPLLRAKDKVKYLASVEQATGTFTVDVMPHSAAQILRAL